MTNFDTTYIVMYAYNILRRKVGYNLYNARVLFGVDYIRFWNIYEPLERQLKLLQSSNDEVDNGVKINYYESIKTNVNQIFKSCIDDLKKVFGDSDFDLATPGGSIQRILKVLNYNISVEAKIFGGVEYDTSAPMEDWEETQEGFLEPPMIYTLRHSFYVEWWKNGQQRKDYFLNDIRGNDIKTIREVYQKIDEVAKTVEKEIEKDNTGALLTSLLMQLII